MLKFYNFNIDIITRVAMWGRVITRVAMWGRVFTRGSMWGSVMKHSYRNLFLTKKAVLK